MYGLPIKNIEFHKKMDLVYSMDSSIVKIWEKNSVSKTNKILCSFHVFVEIKIQATTKDLFFN